MSDLAARDAVFVIDTGLNTLWSGNWIRQSGQQRIIGSFNNGAVGTALGQANGIQALDPFAPSYRALRRRWFQHADVRFLTAVHHKLPVKAVVYNNSSLGLIKLEAESMGLPAWKAMDFPNPDYVTLARACGCRGLQGGKARRITRCHKRRLKPMARPLSIAWSQPTNCPTPHISSSRQ
ncbi:MAG: thiamine pyrophosphate-dependent enzyme [Methylovirgula sp.]